MVVVFVVGFTLGVCCVSSAADHAEAVGDFSAGGGGRGALDCNDSIILMHIFLYRYP